MSCLIVTDPTGDSAGLADAVRARVAAGENTFYVLVPQSRPATAVPRGQPAWAFGLPVAAGPEPTAVAQARARSERQLDLVLAAIRAHGGEADGEVSGPDTVRSLLDLVRRRDVDEIIVAGQHLGSPSRLRRNLRSRLSRVVDVPVTTLSDAA
jgi:hypothetical protein